MMKARDSDVPGLRTYLNKRILGRSTQSASTRDMINPVIFKIGFAQSPKVIVNFTKFSGMFIQISPGRLRQYGPGMETGMDGRLGASKSYLTPCEQRT